MGDIPPVDHLPLLLAGKQRDLNCLSDADKITRKRGLDRLFDHLQSQNLGDAQQVRQALDILLPHCAVLLGDAAERSRELAVEILSLLLFKAENNNELLPPVMDAIKDRYFPTSVEPTEEIRLLVVQFLCKIVKQMPSAVESCADSILQVLGACCNDSFPDVKKNSAVALQHIANTSPATCSGVAKSLVKPLTSVLQHQQQKVRVEGLKALSAVTIANPSATFEDAFAVISKLSFDRSPQVRSALLATVSVWMKNLSESSIDPAPAPRLLPLLFQGLADELPDVKSAAVSAVLELGNNSMEGKMIDDEPERTLADADVPAPLEGRPPAAARAVVRSLLEPMVNLLLGGISDWLVETRLRSCNALLCLCALAEGSIISHITGIAKGVAHGLVDDDEQVRSRCKDISHLIGKLVPLPDTLSVVLKNSPRTGGESAEGWLKLARGASESASQLDAVAALPMALELPSVDAWLVGPGLGDVIGIVGSCISASSQKVSSLAGDAYNASARLGALADGTAFNQQGEQLMGLLAAALDISEEEVVRHHCGNLISQLAQTANSWDANSLDLKVFCSAINRGRAGAVAHAEACIPVMLRIGNPEVDPEVRANLLVFLRGLYEQPVWHEFFRSNDAQFFANIVMPACAWKPGRVHAVLRKAGASVLNAALSADTVSKDVCLQTLLEHSGVWASTLDDEDADVRFLLAKASTHWFKTIKGMIDYELIRKIYPELMKRMDDSNDAIRVETAGAWEQFFQSFPPSFDPGQMEWILRGLFVHLDDSDLKVATAVQNCILAACDVDPVLVESVALEAKEKHRTTARCQNVIDVAVKKQS